MTDRVQDIWSGRTSEAPIGYERLAMGTCGRRGYYSYPPIILQYAGGLELPTNTYDDGARQAAPVVEEIEAAIRERRPVNRAIVGWDTPSHANAA